MNAAQKAGHRLWFISLVLVGLGTVMIYSSSSVLASVRFADSGFYLERQLSRLLLGLGVMVALAHVPLERWRQAARGLLALGVVCLVAVLFLGEGKTQRWIPLPSFISGASFQPSEFVKLVMVLYLADVLARKEADLGDFRNGLLPRLVVIGLVLGLIILQPNLGTALAIAMISVVLLWVGGARTSHLLWTGLAGVPVVAFSLLISPYQRQRLATFFSGNHADPLGAGYQVSQSLLGIGSGGFFGVGIGNSMQKQQFLPEPHTDFVFAFIGEELGLVGTMAVVALFVAFALNGLRIAREAPTYHGFLVATGITAMISVYAVLNIGVVTGVLPTTGLPLPFISYGGSSLVWNLGGVGILLGVARAGRQQPRVSWEAPKVERPQPPRPPADPQGQAAWRRTFGAAG